MPEMRLILDDEDYAIIQQEIAERQAISHRNFGEMILPEGDSNLPGAILAEIVRDLREYRGLFDTAPAATAERLRKRGWFAAADFVEHELG